MNFFLSGEMVICDGWVFNQAIASVPCMPLWEKKEKNKSELE